MKTLYVITFMLLVLPLYAQEDNSKENQRRAEAHQRIRAAKIAFITDRLSLTPDEAEKFWPVYREFAEKRDAIRSEMRQARKNHADEKEVLKRDLDLRQKELDLEKQYADRMQKIISPAKVVALWDAERDFTRLMLQQIRRRHDQADRVQRHRDKMNRPVYPRNNR